ncbi:MAG: hypothetical protein V7607_2605 [Solirubrobacteraceae bacterium]
MCTAVAGADDLVVLVAVRDAALCKQLAVVCARLLAGMEGPQCRQPHCRRVRRSSSRIRRPSGTQYRDLRSARSAARWRAAAAVGLPGCTPMPRALKSTHSIAGYFRRIAGEDFPLGEEPIRYYDRAQDDAGTPPGPLSGRTTRTHGRTSAPRSTSRHRRRLRREPVSRERTAGAAPSPSPTRAVTSMSSWSRLAPTSRSGANPRVRRS